MSVCLALHDVFSAYHNGFQIKWPNDIICKGKKYCGVLIENQLTGQRLESSIIGMGLNINQPQFQNPYAGSLLQLQQGEISLQSVENQLLEKLEKRYLNSQNARQHAKIKEEYLRKLYGYAEEVPVEIEGLIQKVKITDVAEDGFLKALLPSQQERVFNFKELRFIF